MPLSSKPVKFLCIGDSITEGSLAYPSYRYYLGKLFAENAFQCDFVGTRKGVLVDDDQSDYQAIPAGEFTDFTDWDHESRSAWTSSDVLNGACLAPWRDDWNGKFDCDNYQTNKLSVWLDVLEENNSIPDAALIHLGTNDILFGATTEEILNNYHQIIVLLRNKNPHIKIYIAQLIPRNDHDHLNQKIENLNAQMNGYLDEFQKIHSQIHIVNMYNGFDRVHWLYDGLHPNNSGNIFIAQKWFAELFPVLDYTFNVCKCQ